MKIAKVIPICIKDDETRFCNYRPISLLLVVIYKVVETVMHDQIYLFTEHSLFNDNQYGFRSGHSTGYAVMDVTYDDVIDRIITALDSNETLINLFVDLSKAFDTLVHNILLNKLHTYGICDIAIELMESFLKNRKQYVTYDDSISENLHITTCVTQSSIIGPLIFLIYLNDLPKSSKTFKYVMYADDTTLFTTIQSLN